MATAQRMMEKETREQREQRRLELGFNNPKKDYWARRKNRSKWIGGMFFTSELLRKAQEARIVKKIKERIRKRMRWYHRFYYWLRRLWLKIKRGLKKK